MALGYGTLASERKDYYSVAAVIILRVRSCSPVQTPQELNMKDTTGFQKLIWSELEHGASILGKAPSANTCAFLKKAGRKTEPRAKNSDTNNKTARRKLAVCNLAPLQVFVKSNISTLMFLD